MAIVKFRNLMQCLINPSDEDRYDFNNDPIKMLYTRSN